MAVLISGKLIGPNGDPRPNVTIMLVAVKTSSAVVKQAPSTSTTTADGSYSLSVEVGTHNVMIEAYGRPFEKVGQITVYSDSKPGTLNEFLTIPGQDELTPAIVAMVDDMRAATVLYAQQAGIARDEAKSAAENAQNIADANTYHITQSDPDGTIAGLAGTPVGKYFRVGQGSGGGFKYYLNDNGVALEVSETVGVNALNNVEIKTRNAALSVGFFNGLSVTSASSDADGKTISMTTENGDVHVATNNGMQSVSELGYKSKKSLSYGFYNGEQIRQVIVDSEWNTISLSTDKSSYVNDGISLVEIKPEIGSVKNSLSYGFVDGKPVAKLTSDIITGVVIDVTTSDGNVYSMTGGGFQKVTNLGLNNPKTDVIYSGYQQIYLNQQSSFYYSDPGVVYIFLDMGQSNSVGQGSGGVPTIAGAPVYPENALMLDTGVRAVSSPATSLVPLIETQNGQLSETSCSSWVNHTIRDLEQLTGMRPTILAINASLGGQQYYKLTRGQDTYKRLQIALQSAVRLITQMGKTPIVAACRWMQGEDEVAIDARTKYEYESQLRQLERYVTDDAKKITGQVDSPVFLINQISWSSKYPEGLWRQPIKQAQLLRTDRVIPVGPIYQYPMSDYVHMNSWGRNYLGQCLAIACVNEVFGASYTPLLPGDYYWLNSTTLRLQISVQYPPVVIDTSGVIALEQLENYGFNFDDYTDSPPVITGVSTSGADSVDINLDKPPATSWRLAYAMKKQDDVDRAGPITGARGCLRDSAAHQNIYDASVKTYNWCPSFIIHSR
ncbi:prophage tail fiber N-terminal domain-containing protein [Serratia marcescens]|uniref:prophage tail fiber N-terminal domain-containing protein n=1 Tax=Serratia marcescens TaxID=615 RepID=UPI000AD13416|nr:prophage tail fiber N-terminal domain-containing protein [Serratia marcescens]